MEEKETDKDPAANITTENGENVEVKVKLVTEQHREG